MRRLIENGIHQLGIRRRPAAVAGLPDFGGRIVIDANELIEAPLFKPAEPRGRASSEVFAESEQVQEGNRDCLKATQLTSFRGSGTHRYVWKRLLPHW